MSRVLVTGAGGYLGPHVVHALIENGHHVVATVKAIQQTAILDKSCEVITADIFAPDFDAKTWGDTPHAVIHLAWQDGFRHNSPRHMAQVSSHFKLLTRFADSGVKRIVSLGTMHEIGYWEGIVEAETPTNPLSQYGIAKDALRRSLALAVPVTTSLAWARAFYIYGDDYRSSSIFQKLLAAADRGEKEFPFTTGKNLYDFIRVEELGRQIACLVEAEEITGTINCCTGEPVSLATQVEKFIVDNDLGLNLKYGAYSDRPYDSPGIWGDAKTIRQLMSRN